MAKIRAVFVNIQQHLADQIQGADQRIRIAMAWLTDQNLYTLLCQRATKGIKIELLLLNDDINQAAANLNLEYLRQAGAEVLLINPIERNRMHNKFCIIDADTVITGSYNWTFQAQQNDENIVVVSGDPDFTADFISNFNRLKQKYGGKVAGSPDLSLLCKRLEMLRNALDLTDDDDIRLQRQKTAHLFDEIPDIWLQIEQCLVQNDYQQATTLIGEWLQKMFALMPYEDLEFEELLLELKVLELQIAALRDEKTDMETLNSAFNQRYQIELGELILQILELQTQQAEQAAQQAPDNDKKQQAYEDLKNQYQQAHQEYTQEREKQIPNLSPDDENLLRKLFRKASKLCFPDLIHDPALNAEAERIFIELHAAYEAKDVERVKQILDYLENGNPFTPSDNKTLKKDQLRARITHLKQVLSKLIEDIERLRNSETYQTIIKIGNDWDAYFTQAKKQLEEQLHHLQNSQQT